MLHKRTTESFISGWEYPFDSIREHKNDGIPDVAPFAAYRIARYLIQKAVSRQSYQQRNQLDSTACCGTFPACCQSAHEPIKSIFDLRVGDIHQTLPDELPVFYAQSNRTNRKIEWNKSSVPASAAGRSPRRVTPVPPRGLPPGQPLPPLR